MDPELQELAQAIDCFAQIYYLILQACMVVQVIPSGHCILLKCLRDIFWAV
jgi:hypothetical protein